MSSTYPTTLDSLSTTHSDSTNETIHAATVNDLADAVNKIEAELGTLPKGGAADVKTRIANTETVANAAVPKSTVTTAGDLIYGTGSAAVARLGAGSAGQHLATGATPSWVYPPGYEFDYKELTTGDVTVSGTNDAGATTIITSNSVTFDGSTAVWIEFSTPRVLTATGAGAQVVLTLWEDTTDLGRIGEVCTGNGTQAGEATARLVRRRTPAAGAHTYTVKAWRTVGNGTVGAGAGGTAAYMPATLRIAKAG